MFKKIIACILAVSLLLSMAVVSVSAEEVSAERVTKFENAVTLLTKLGAISGSEYQFDSEITKAKFVELMSKIVPVGDGAEEPIFDDVPATHANFKVIQGFADAGYIDGYAGSFEPDRAITYNEALYILLNMMGYNDFMNLRANYPAGGWNIANELKIKMKNKGAIAGDIFYLVYQALKADRLSLAGMTKGNFVFGADNGDTLLEEYFEIEVKTGILKSNGKVSISTQHAAEDGAIVVTDTVYKAEELCTILPGSEVDVFYGMDSFEVVCVVATEENKIVEINSADIEGFRNMKYDYEANGASKTLKIRTGTDVVINNNLVLEMPSDRDMVPANGKVIAVDNGEGSGYAVVYVNSYDSFVVKSIVKDNNKAVIYPDQESPANPVVAYLEENTPVIYDAEGDVLSVEDITVGTVISVMGNTATDLYDVDEREGNDAVTIAEEIVISTAIVTGDLTTVYNGTPKYLVIDGVKYPVAQSAEYILAAISPQGNMTFFLDFMGNIVELDSEISGGMAYGYLLGAKLAYNDEGERVISVKLLSEIGSIISYYLCPERVTVDDVRSGKYYDPEELVPELFGGENISLLNKFKTIAEGSASKVIRYDVNDEREIVKVDFAKSIADASNPTVNDRLFVSRTEFEAYFRKSVKTFSAQVSVDENTIVFKIPERPEEASNTDYEVIRDVTKLSDGRYKVEAYKLGDESLTASVIVAKQNFKSYSDSAQYYVVKDIEQTLDEFDEVTYNVTLDGTSGEKTYAAKYASVVEAPHALNSTTAVGRELKEGDIVRCLIDTTGTVLLDISVCYKSLEGEAAGGIVSSLPNGTWNDLRIASLNAYSMDDKLISFTDDAGIASETLLSDDKCETYMIDSFKIFKLEVSEVGVEVTEGTKADIKTYKNSSGNYSRAVLVTQSATGKLLFVYVD